MQLNFQQKKLSFHQKNKRNFTWHLQKFQGKQNISTIL